MRVGGSESVGSTTNAAEVSCPRYHTPRPSLGLWRFRAVTLIGQGVSAGMVVKAAQQRRVTNQQHPVVNGSGGCPGQRGGGGRCPRGPSTASGPRPWSWRYWNTAAGARGPPRYSSVRGMSAALHDGARRPGGEGRGKGEGPDGGDTPVALRKHAATAACPGPSRNPSPAHTHPPPLPGHGMDRRRRIITRGETGVGMAPLSGAGGPSRIEHAAWHDSEGSVAS